MKKFILFSIFISIVVTVFRIDAVPFSRENEISKSKNINALKKAGLLLSRNELILGRELGQGNFGGLFLYDKEHEFI